ncbi:hypothetical protein AGR6A_pAt60089 [Agrobacterium sp. NCPPB 925]|nr:hypothetical protein AGR6A_pAt60089 [Agrobacterium sp. NCPPB 925]
MQEWRRWQHSDNAPQCEAVVAFLRTFRIDGASEALKSAKQAFLRTDRTVKPHEHWG